MCDGSLDDYWTEQIEDFEDYDEDDEDEII